jgi:hypothetical protein
MKQTCTWPLLLLPAWPHCRAPCPHPPHQSHRCRLLPDGVRRRTCKKQDAVKQILRKLSVFNALTSVRWMRPAAGTVEHASLVSESEAEPAVLKHGWRIAIRHFATGINAFPRRQTSSKVEHLGRLYEVLYLVYCLSTYPPIYPAIYHVYLSIRPSTHLFLSIYP